MKRAVFSTIITVLMAGTATVAGATITMSASPVEVAPGESVVLQCRADESWSGSLASARVAITDPGGAKLLRRGSMQISGTTATYNYTVPSTGDNGDWSYKCELRQRKNRDEQIGSFTVAEVSDPTPVNNPPVAENDSATTPFETATTINVGANDTDIDNNLDLASVTVSSDPSNGAASEGAGGTVLYTPNDGFSGNDSFSYRICDLEDECVSATVTVTVSDPVQVNNPPVAADDSAATEFETQVTVDVPANDMDADGNLNPNSVAILGVGPTNGNAQPNANGTVLYIPNDGFSGEDTFSYQICDSDGLCDEAKVTITVAAAEPPTNEPPVAFLNGSIPEHNTIEEYSGPATCVSCHQEEAQEMLDSLHMKWAGPTPDLTNDTGEELGKGNKGINTFCTYAPSSKGACYSCHVRADGNAPDAPTVDDVDCMMCHNDSYQRKFVADENNTETVTNINGEQKTYVFGKVDAEGNYTTVPDYNKMTINVVDAARTVHMPTNTSCLRCHAKAGGGDWTKRGDMGLSSAHATIDEDVHLAKAGADLSCVSCHSALDHKISGRGIDLRQTEADAPTCSACHSETPHSNETLNRHAGGQVSCQVCHIREYAKGGETEISRDWDAPVWNAAFCSGQGGFVGHEVKASNVKPEYVWFDGTSYVYNVGEKIEIDTDASGNEILHMAKANGQPFDGKSKIVPIKRHFTNTPLDDNGKIIPPAIMWMFMTGNFDRAVQEGLAEQDPDGKLYSGNYRMVDADAEMLITHGVDQKSEAPSCIECHDGSGSTPDGAGMVPFDALGYHQVPGSVQSCTLCHDQKNMQFEAMHDKHRTDQLSCSSCHTPEPTGVQQGVCSSCHGSESWGSDGHKKHVKGKGYDCITCHTFS